MSPNIANKTNENMGKWLMKVTSKIEPSESIKHGDVIVVPERSTFSSPTDPPVTDLHDQPSASLSLYVYLDHPSGSWVPDKY